MTLTRNQAKAIVKPEGYVEYNGIVFNELIKTKLEITAVPNHAKTGVKYEEYNFTIEAIITPSDMRGAVKTIISNDLDAWNETGDWVNEYSSNNTEKAPNYYIYSRDENLDETTDAPFRLMRRHLMTPGGRFAYAKKGAGEDLIFDSNTETNNRRQDICFGPMPKVLSFELIAGNKAARVVFQVLIRTKHCTVSGNSLGILDFNVSTSIKTNSKGYKTITRRGYLEVSLPRKKSSQTAVSGGSAGDTVFHAERRIEKAYEEVLQNLIGINMQGYTVSHDVDFSPDHRSCNFTITYTEIESPNAYPNGVTNIRCSHAIRSSLYGEGENLASTIGYARWMNTMNCSITLKPNTSPIRAWYIFTQILNERLQYEVEYAVEHDGVDRLKIPLILEIQLEEEIFSHEYRFKVVWMVDLQNLDDVFAKTKLFSEIQSTNWFDWTTEMRSVNGVHGAYPLIPGKIGTDYYETNLCNQESFDLHYSINLETTRGFPQDFFQGLFGTNCPPESSSWVDYQRKFYVVGSVGEQIYQRYQSATFGQERVPLSANPKTDKTLTMLDYYADSPEEDYFTQDFRNDQYQIVERGYAIRMGGPTDPPVWTNIGGKAVKLEKGGDNVSNQVISSAGNCPMVITTWERKYRILGKPNGDMSRAKQESGDERNKQ